MCVVTRSPCGKPAASHSFWLSAKPVGETSHIATLQASATNWRTSSRPMPLPPPVTTAVLPANSVMRTSLAFRGRSRYGPSATSPPVGESSVGAMSDRDADALPDEHNDVVHCRPADARVPRPALARRADGRACRGRQRNRPALVDALAVIGAALGSGAV